MRRIVVGKITSLKVVILAAVFLLLGFYFTWYRPEIEKDIFKESEGSEHVADMEIQEKLLEIQEMRGEMGYNPLTEEDIERQLEEIKKLKETR